jgi:hypothetical protein
LEEEKNMTKFWPQIFKGTDHSEDLGIDGRVISQWNLKYGRRMLTGFIWLKTGTGGGFL